MIFLLCKMVLENVVNIFKKKKVKKYIHFEILKINLVTLLHICNLLKVRLIYSKKIMKLKINAKKQQDHENQLICIVYTDCIP